MPDALPKIKKIMADKFGVPPDQITVESDLSGDFNLSNLEINDLIAIISHEFELEHNAENETEKIKTVEDLISFIDTYSEDL